MTEICKNCEYLGYTCDKCIEELKKKIVIERLKQLSDNFRISIG